MATENISELPATTTTTTVLEPISAAEAVPSDVPHQQRSRSWWRTLIAALHEFHENDLFTSAAAMSYFGLLALFPLLLVLLAASNELTQFDRLLRRVINIYPGSNDFLDSTIRSLANINTGVVISCVFVALWAGSWVFAVCERAINRVWRVPSRRFFHGRALTLGLMASIGVVLSLSIILTSALVVLRRFADSILFRRALADYGFLVTLGGLFWQSLFALASLMISIILFNVVYRLVPNTSVSIRDTLPSAMLAGFLWEVAKYIFAVSLHYFHYDQIYGSVGAVVAVLTWGYVSSLILLFGAQLSAVIHAQTRAQSAHT